MEEANETLWRSMDSSLDMIDAVSAEVSFKSLASDDVSENTPPAVSPQKLNASLGEGLIDALRNLQIASVRKPSKFRSPMISTINPEESEVDGHQHSEENPQTDESVSLQPVDTPEEIEQLVEHLLQQVQPAVSIEPLQESINIPIAEENPSVVNNKIEEKDSENGKGLDSIPTEPIIAIAPEILDNMKKSVKSLLKPPTAIRNVTKGVSPILQTRTKCRVTKTPSLTQLNQSMINNQTRKKVTVEEAKRLSSLKRQPIKKVVATVVATKEGIKLKEEKISNFGIPVTIERKKKRTQAVPFSFATRGKSSAEQQKSQQKLPMRDSNSVNQQKQPVLMKSAIKENTNKSQQMKFTSMNKSSVRNESMNKENQSKTAIGGSKLNTGNRREIGEMRGRIERKIDVKAQVKIPAPVQPKKNVTIPLGK